MTVFARRGISIRLNLSTARCDDRRTLALLAIVLSAYIPDRDHEMSNWLFMHRNSRFLNFLDSGFKQVVMLSDQVTSDQVTSDEVASDEVASVPTTSDHIPRGDNAAPNGGYPTVRIDTAQ